MTETVNGFRGEYFFLSNFYVSSIQIEFEGETLVFQTGEHAFQGMKVAAALDPSGNLAALRKLAAEPSPSKAKYWGRSIRIDLAKWDAMAEACMRRTLALKFGQHPDLRQRLIDTGDVNLVEYNDWHDTRWGVDSETRQGGNLLGKLLMELRDSYRTMEPH